MGQPRDSILPVTNEEINNQLYNACYQWFSQLLINDRWAHTFTTVALLVAVTVLLLAVDFVIRKVLVAIFSKLIRRNEDNWGNYLIKNKFFARLSLLVPLIVLGEFLPLIFRGFPDTLLFLDRLVSIVVAATVLQLVNSLLKTGRDILKTRKGFVDKPLDSYLQVLQIFLFFIAGTIIFTILTGKSPGAFLVSMGAMSAILMLVFKDTILGFVASIQVSANDSVRVGDWITMPKYNADGDVLQINLNNIRIRNFDRTIVTIPTHTLLSESFTNYRGMFQSEGRRIKRSVNIKISTIKYVSEEDLERLKTIRLLKPFIEERQQEIDAYNRQHNPDVSMPVNGRRMTNVGLFRAYITEYAKAHPKIQKTGIIMVRQLAPTEHGLPLELYMFTDGATWVFFENVMADIFDHLFASIRYFDLEVFEAPASSDLRRIPVELRSSLREEKN